MVVSGLSVVTEVRPLKQRRVLRWERFPETPKEQVSIFLGRFQRWPVTQLFCPDRWKMRMTFYCPHFEAHPLDPNPCGLLFPTLCVTIADLPGCNPWQSPLYKGRTSELLPWCDLFSAAYSMAKLWGKEMEKGVILILNGSEESESGNGLNWINSEHPWHAQRWRRMESEVIGFFMFPNSILQLSYRILAFSCGSSILSSTSRLDSMVSLSVSDLDCPPSTA